MSSSKSAGDAESKSPRPDSADESEDESEVLEESPCGRWQKRREEVTQRDVPGIDCAFLAMDTEEGMEVVWNEVQFSEKKNFKAQQDKIKQVFDNLIQLEHANIVKFHKYWTDTKGDKPRVIFITEYMSSGSLKQFLKKTKKNNKTLKSWKRWCTQILSALSYLHSCDPPIIHGNLTCDTIFIQHNGLIKIGSVAPDAIHQHVKTMNELKNMHYIAPEYGGTSGVPVTTAVDIYSFGMCTLEMAVLEIQGNGDSGRQVTEESIMKTLGSLEDPQQRDFIEACLRKDPNQRLKARELLFHKVLFEVHSLKLLAAHNFIQHSNALSENITENRWLRPEPELVIAEIKHPGDSEPVAMQVKQLPVLELEKFLEDVKNGIYPLTAFEISHTQTMRPRPPSPEVAESVKSETPEPADVESRSIVKMSCSVHKLETDPTALQMTILLRMDDKMNRQLECDFTNEDSAHNLAEELVFHGFINKGDQDKVANLMEDSIRNGGQNSKPAQLIVTNT